MTAEPTTVAPTPPGLAAAERQQMAETPETREWQIPAHGDVGPVRIEVALPRVRITDSAGRYILLTPQQSGILGMKTDRLYDWISDIDNWGDADADG